LSNDVGTEYLASVALDSKEGLLYYADQKNHFIGEMTTEGNKTRRLFSTIAWRPYAIVVDSNSR